MPLRKFKGFDSLTRQQRSDICNGAGAAGSWYSKFIPNTLYGLDCKIVFDIHDYGYWAGRSTQAKIQIDLDMLANLVHMINFAPGTISGLLAPLRRRRAMKYYEMVHLHGAPAFWASKPHFSRK